MVIKGEQCASAKEGGNKFTHSRAFETASFRDLNLSEFELPLLLLLLPPPLPPLLRNWCSQEEPEGGTCRNHRRKGSSGRLRGAFAQERARLGSFFPDLLAIISA